MRSDDRLDALERVADRLTLRLDALEQQARRHQQAALAVVAWVAVAIGSRLLGLVGFGP